jgi:hypothetical protein
MRLLRTLIPSLLLVGVQVAQAASSWSFNEAVISVSSKGAAGAQFKDKYVKLGFDTNPNAIDGYNLGLFTSMLTGAGSRTVYLSRSRWPWRVRTASRLS